MHGGEAGVQMRAEDSRTSEQRIAPMHRASSGDARVRPARKRRPPLRLGRRANVTMARTAVGGYGRPGRPRATDTALPAAGGAPAHVHAAAVRTTPSRDLRSLAARLCRLSSVASRRRGLCSACPSPAGGHGPCRARGRVSCHAPPHTGTRGSGPPPRRRSVLRHRGCRSLRSSARSHRFARVQVVDPANASERLDRMLGGDAIGIGQHPRLGRTTCRRVGDRLELGLDRVLRDR